MANQKLKTLILMRILMERTDEDHVLNASELIRILEQEYGIRAERKTIYADIQTLLDFGVDILQTRGKNAGYYVASRMFELPELKLLVDAVQSSRFITEKKSQNLIGKLEKLCSRSQAKQLAKQVVIYNRPKTENERIYYNVDRIHEAIFRDRRVKFQYAKWTVKKELQLRKEGAYYVVSPWALTWDDENYYLIAYDDDSSQMRHYRVDKMLNLELLEQGRISTDSFREFDLVAFAKKTFGMYGGQDTEVTLRCRNELAGVVLDRFGHTVWMTPDGEEYFKARVTVAVSSQFFGWVTAVGKGMQIVGPPDIREEYRKYLEEIAGAY